MTDRTKYVKVYNDLTDHPAFMDLDPEHVGLWLMAVVYASRNLTDGLFPTKALRRWGASPGAEQPLLDAGRWHAPGHDCAACPQPPDGQLYVHDYLEHQRSKAEIEGVSAKRREAGKLGGRARAAKLAPQPAPAAQAPAPKTQSPAATPADVEHFAEFYAAYPRKVGKGAAAKAYAKATKDTDPAAILAGLRNAVEVWRATGTEDRFIPHPATWLNAGRWADEQPKLPDMPGQPPARASFTMAQCSNYDPHGRHEWADGRITSVCLGVEA